MNESITPLESEIDPFEDADVLMSLRDIISELIIECTDAKETGNTGCGCGSADAEFDLDGLKFTVSISLSGDDEVEH